MRTHPAALALTAALGALYFALLRDPILTWGATDAEAAARLPGDELLEAADGVTTRAIEIDAPATAVWPWLAQMGPSPRGGVYTYDWIENLLGLDIHSVDRVLPAYQDPRSATRSTSAPTGCESGGSIASMSSPGSPMTATGCGRSCWRSVTAGRG